MVTVKVTKYSGASFVSNVMLLQQIYCKIYVQKPKTHENTSFVCYDVLINLTRSSLMSIRSYSVFCAVRKSLYDATQIESKFREALGQK